MRINVYSQELTKEISVVAKVADTGITYYGVRMFLASPEILHHTPDDDDRSAITFWIPHAESFTQKDLAFLFSRMANAVLACPEETLVSNQNVDKLTSVDPSTINPSSGDLIIKSDGSVWRKNDS